MDYLKISKSKLRRELLRLYFSNPDKEYYLRELERILGMSVANIRRELLKLKEIGLFKSKNVGNLTYYSLNKGYPLYAELKNIVFKTIGIEGSLRDIVGKDKHIKIAFIHGSFAAGEESASSDIDILIIGKPTEDTLMHEIDKLEKELKREINYIIYSEAEYKKRKTRKDSFVGNILSRPKIFLKGSQNEL